MLVLGGAGVASAAGGPAASDIVDGAISGTGDYTITVSGTTAGLGLGNSGGTLSEAVTINGFDSIVLDGGHTGHANMFNAYKTTTLNFTNIGEVVSADTSDLSNTTVFHAQGGTVNIGSESAPLTNITLKNVGNGFMVQQSGSMTVWANDISVEAVKNAAQAPYSNEGGTLIINANNISLASSEAAGASSMGNGNIQITASGQLSIEGSNAVNANAGSLSLSADEIYIKENNNNAWNALRAANGGSVTVSPTSKADIIGNVHSEGSGSSASVNLGSEGSLTGKVTTDDSCTTTLSIGANSTWNVTDSSNVTNLGTTEGIISLGDNEVTVTNLSGESATVKTVVENGEATGSLNVGGTSGNTTPQLNVLPTNAKGEALTADDISAAQLASVIDQTIAGEADEALTEKATASAARGIVNEAVTVDENGKVVSGGGVSSVTEAVLESASVNTVALDKILTNDVRKRLGDIRSDKNQTGVWMRWDGGKLKGNSGLTNNFNTIQIGGDTKINDSWRIGAAGSFTHGDGDFDRGNSELEGFSFALYTTWMAENGMFADVVARIGHFSTEMNVEGLKGDMDNRVASLSGEYGWRINLCDQFFVEPQIELAYTYVNSEDLKLGEAEYHFDNVDSLTGRAGFVAGWNLPDDRGNVYARASVVQQFMGDAKITGTKGIAHNVQEIDGEDTWMEYGIGANIKLTDKTYIWADVERTEGADIEEEWRGTVGIRYSF